MATVYKNHSVWYINTSYDNQRLTRSLRKKGKQVTKKLKRVVELELLEDLHSSIKPRKRNLSFDEIVNR